MKMKSWLILSSIRFMYMRRKLVYLLVISLLLIDVVNGQELQANVTVLANRISSQVDHKIFTTLQSALYDFLNNRKWTNENFQANEKIPCNFLLNLTGSPETNVYTASLTVQAGRPIYNSS